MKPKAVLLSDNHYSLATLAEADAAARQAVAKANELKVPLVCTGDLHDTKASMRGECVNAMIETFKMCNSPPYFIVGNHDKINEKSKEHSLNFLHQFGPVIDTPVKDSRLGYLIPYQHDKEELKSYLKTIPKKSLLLMHQGLTGTNSGEYYQDNSAIAPQDVAGHRVISGHYHARQDITLPDGGLWSYVGNPYTMNFGEADDPEKGYQILQSDGSLEFVPTRLRKHVVFTMKDGESTATSAAQPGDILKIKIEGTKEFIGRYSRQYLKTIHDRPFKLELIPTDSKSEVRVQTMSKSELLDASIEALHIKAESKDRLKKLWRSLCE